MQVWRTKCLAVFFTILATSAHAQDPARIFDFFQNQILNEAARQQQRQYQRQQQQQIENIQNALHAAWIDCFKARILQRCDEAMQFDGLSSYDRHNLARQRADIATAIQAQQDQARRERAEQIERDRQAQIEATNEQQRQQLARDEAARRLQFEWDQAAARQRQQAFDAQQAEAEQARQRDAKEKEATALSDLASAFDACGRYDADGCDRILASPYASRPEFRAVDNWRTTALVFRADRFACQTGKIEACNTAIGSAAATPDDRSKLIEWRAAAMPVTQAAATVITTGSVALATAQSIPAMIRELPLSTQITGGVASFLAMTLAWVLARRTPIPKASGAIVVGTAPPVAERKRLLPLWRSLRRAARRRVIRAMAMRRSGKIATEASAPPAIPPPLPTMLPASVTDDPPRDTETAVDAMQLAHAYMSEFHDDIGNTLTDPAFAAQTLNTLSLISRQLDIADRADPSATLTVEGKDGEPNTLSLTMMKGAALYYEATCRMADSPKRAVQLFEQCLEQTPDAANAYFWIGTLHADMFNKARAIEAFEKALALEPGNLEYRKALVRTQNISGTQVAFDRAVTGTRKTINFTRWVWTGIVVFTLISFVSALIRQDTATAVAIFFVFLVFGLGLRSITAAKTWFSTNLKL